MHRRFVVLSCCALLFLLSWQVFMRNLDEPQALVWDETYHVTSAYKYLHGNFFMEPHPPLGKLVLALSERFFGTNDVGAYAAIAETDRLETLPPGFSIRGLRILPAFLGCCSVVLIFVIVLSLFGSVPGAFAFGVIALCDTAFVLQSRAAMLDSTQIFCLLSAIALAMRALSSGQSRSISLYVLCGVFSGLALSVKLSSAPILSLGPALLIQDALLAHRCGKPWLQDLVRPAGYFVCAAFFAFCAVWYIHFALIRERHPTRWYGVDNVVRDAVKGGETGSLLRFPELLRASTRYSIDYHRGVPALQVCNPQENGSSPWRWLVGGKSIPYWWQRDGERTRYLYLVANPIVWTLSLLGVLTTLVFYGARYLFRLPKLPGESGASGVLVAIYLITMAGFLVLDRVMYLYHYLFPMLLGLLLLASALRIMFSQASSIGRGFLSTCVTLWIALSLGSFYFFSPFVYGDWLRFEDFRARVWAPWWGLDDVH